jgi:hypothetical protein
MPLMKFASTEPAPGAPAEEVNMGLSEPALRADVAYALAGYGLLAVGAVVGIVLWKVRQPGVFQPGAGISVFAPLYILAQAIERFIEPFSSLLGRAGVQGEAGTHRKAGATTMLYHAIRQQNPHEAAKWQRTVDQIRRNTAVIAWGLASAIGMALCGLFGLYFMRLVGFTAVPSQIDIVISGLAVGSGTKPLHELIKNVQTAKEQRQDPIEKQAA